MTPRQTLASALTLTDQAIAALESGEDAAERWVTRALSACEAAASLPMDSLTGPEEAAAIRALAERVRCLSEALGAATRQVGTELERLQASRRATDYGASAPAVGGEREA